MLSHLRSTKEKLLYILKRDSESSIKEIMDYFTISNVAVRRHLNDLIREGFVAERTEKQEIGRPYIIYSLTKKGHDTFPRQYEQFSQDMLKDVKEVGGDEAVDAVLTARKNREEAELESALSDKTFDEKIALLYEMQDKKGYMHEIEQTSSGDYLVRNYNCPIYSLASSYDVICGNEKKMYQSLFPGSDVTAHAYMTKGKSYCSWTITKPENETITKQEND